MKFIAEIIQSCEPKGDILVCFFTVLDTTTHWKRFEPFHCVNSLYLVLHCVQIIGSVYVNCVMLGSSACDRGRRA